MYDHGHGHKQSTGSKAAGTKEAERRGNDRHPITASAEVIELGSGARFATRTTDLGPGGCFVDTMVPFPVGANVRVKVHKGKTQFETSGVVVYSQTGLGMGIAFSDMELSQRSALDTWLAELTGEKQAAHHLESSGYAGSQSSEHRPGDKTALVRLVRLMITKGILTEAEGASVLMDPLL
jgi:PilZ domain